MLGPLQPPSLDLVPPLGGLEGSVETSWDSDLAWTLGPIRPTPPAPEGPFIAPDADTLPLSWGQTLNLGLC